MGLRESARSLKVRFSAAAVAIIVLTFGGLGLLQYFQKRAELYASLEAAVSAALSRLVLTEAEPLWILDPVSARAAAEAELSSADLLALVLLQEGGAPFLALRKEGEAVADWDGVTPPPLSRARSAEIRREGKTIGSVTLHYGDARPRAVLAALLRDLALQIAVAAVLLGAVVVLLLGRLVLRPLYRLGTEMEALSKGEADLTRCMDVERRDEIGRFVTGFNAFVCKLAEIVLRIKDSQRDLGTVGDELATTSRLAGEQIRAIDAGTEGVRDMTLRQEEGVAGAESAAGAVEERIRTLEGLIESQVAGVVEASASIEEMVGNIGAMSSSIEKMADRFRMLAEASERGKATQAASSEKARLIESQSDLLLEANSVIAGIASATNLLAMNAAIEAAHAGDVGRGFSVVADEIRKLAENAASQSKEIGNQLRNVKSAIEDVVGSSRESEESFNLVVAEISGTETLVQEMERAIVEQREGSRQILEALREMNGAAIAVSSAAKDMARENAGLSSAFESLKRLAGSIAESALEVARRAAEVGRAMDSVSALADRTRKSIIRNEEAIGAFKVS